MWGFVVLGLGALVLAYAIDTYRCFAKNLADAKASGIPYIITPIYMFNLFWMLTHQMTLPYLRKLPESWRKPWLDVMDTQWTWQLQYGFYKDLGSDTFLTISPKRNVLWTADADVISQMTTRRVDFPKPIDMYGSIDIFGKNVVTTEGQVWRQHRKITSPPFTEKNNHMVWDESILQAQAMLKGWVGPSGEGNRTVSSVAADAMRLSLYVISLAGFGVRLTWPGADEDSNVKADTTEKSRQAGVTGEGMTEGHTMTYTDALQTLLHHLIVVILVPKFLMRYVPIQYIRTGYESFREWGMYMNEMFQAKKADIIAGKETDGLDLMGALVKGAGITAASSGEQTKQILTDAEIMGNAFVFILAGHETAANSIHFSILYLALKISSQRRLQTDLDTIFEGKPTSEWDYERDLPKLFGGMAGAILAEELRLIAPVANIPKCTLKNTTQPIVIKGKKCTVPQDVLINFTTNAVHRNPKFWPAGPPSDPQRPVHHTSNTDNDLEEFKPERWFVKEPNSSPANGANAHANGHAKGANGHADPKAADSHTAIPAATTIAPSAETDDLGVSTAADTAQNLYRPPRGAYIPFSEGYRACIGRRFAQVEVLAVLAVLFSQYSVELAVDEWASDEEVEKMGEAERREVWGKAWDSAMEKLRTGLESVITLQMRRDVVPLRWVKRGSERFNFTT
ncbi:hypothetical protein MMC30_000804 [Trapelia coarctata]|nr:hypothetical protein [Trapelia coarctata]